MLSVSNTKTNSISALTSGLQITGPVTLTGDTSYTMPVTPSGLSLVNKEYVDSHTPAGATTLSELTDGPSNYGNANEVLTTRGNVVPAQKWAWTSLSSSYATFSCRPFTWDLSSPADKISGVTDLPGVVWKIGTMRMVHLGITRPSWDIMVPGFTLVGAPTDDTYRSANVIFNPDEIPASGPGTPANIENDLKNWGTEVWIRSHFQNYFQAWLMWIDGTGKLNLTIRAVSWASFDYGTNCRFMYGITMIYDTANPVHDTSTGY